MTNSRLAKMSRAQFVSELENGNFTIIELIDFYDAHIALTNALMERIDAANEHIVKQATAIQKLCDAPCERSDNSTVIANMQATIDKLKESEAKFTKLYGEASINEAAFKKLAVKQQSILMDHHFEIKRLKDKIARMRDIIVSVPAANDKLLAAKIG